MKTTIILLLTLASFSANAFTQKLSCEDGNIQIELNRSFWGTLKFNYKDQKRKASTTFEKSSSVFGGDFKINLTTLEMYPESAIAYTALISPFDGVMEADVGEITVPMLLSFTGTDGKEVQLQVYCEIIE
jgi:hypothetical protein